MKTKRITGLILALILICVAYANHFGNGFHFDDFHTVADNPAIRSLKNIPRFFTDTTTFSVLPANRTYRPTVSTSLALDYALGHGYTLFWFHLSTFLLFLVEVGLLYLLYRLLLHKVRPGAEGNEWIALAGAAWFGVHPAMAETVNYVIQRGDLYCTLGCVAALYVYAQWPARRSMGLYLLPFVFALLSKPPAAVFPVLLFLYVFFFEAEGAGRWLRAAVAVVPSVVVTGLLLWLQSAMTPKSFAPSMLNATDYRLTQPFVWMRYFGALVLPIHLNVDTDLSPFATLNAQAIAGLLFLVMLGVAIWWTAQRRVTYPIAFGLLWFVVTQLPTSLYPLSEVENDHRMFFSFAGLMLAAVWAVVLLWDRVASVTLRSVAIALVVMLLCGYAYGTHVRNAVWHDEDSLWLDDVQKSPKNGRGLMIYGLTLMRKAQYPEALDYFERATQFAPNYATLEINLGIVNGAMADKGDATRTAEAERHFLRAIALTPQDDSVYAYYGRWLSDHGRIAEAITQLQTAITVNPARMFQRDELILTEERAGDLQAAKKAAEDTLAVAPDEALAKATVSKPIVQDATYWLNRSLNQYRSAQYEDSITSAKKALALDPKMSEAWNNIGAGYGAMGRWDEAIKAEQQALALRPNLQIAKNNLASYIKLKAGGVTVASGNKSAAQLLDESLALNRAGRFEESIAAAQSALKIDPTSAIAWNNIAAANESLKRWDPAIAAAKKALALQPDFQMAKNNLAWSISQKQLGK